MATPVDETFAFPAPLALFLDFDGTLADFHADPDQVRLTDARTDLLERLAVALDGALALISGRDIRDLSARTPTSLWRLGNHGLYEAAPHRDSPADLPDFPPGLFADIRRLCDAHSGVWIEEKGPVLAIHTRANPEAAPRLHTDLKAVIDTHDAYLLQSGHHIFDIKPAAANKGTALLRRMEEPPFHGRTPVMIGDDTTDEDAFAAAETLGGFGIKIGEGKTRARYRIRTIAHLYSHLETLT